MKATEIGLKNPYLVIVLVLAVIVVGVTSLLRIPADLLPEFKTPAVQIVTFYPGMPPEVMERDIMSRLQRWTGQSIGIEHQEAKAMMGVCVVKDFFREDIGFDTAMSQVTSYAVSDMFYLPPGTIPPMVMPFDPTASVPLCLVSVSSPTMTEKELYDVAYYELRNRLQSIQGVIAPAVYGGVLRRILAYVDPVALEARNLSPMDVVKALKEQSVFVPTGNAKFGDIDYQIVSNAMPEKVEELNDIPISAQDEAVVFMRDVAEVKDSHQIQSNIVKINGRRQAYIPIYRQPGANTIEIVTAIRAQLARILQRLREMNPDAKDLALEVVMDQSQGVSKSIRGLQIAALLGAILAGLVVLIFLRSFLSTLVIFLAIPLSILAAMIGLFYTGDTINSITLGGLALAIGILVDQSIVVLDNITRHLRAGKKPFQACLDGASEVALPVLVSTITFIVVFFPVVFLTGISRYLFQPLAVTVVLAVIASYIVAIFVIPSMCSLVLRVKASASSAQPLSAQLPGWYKAGFAKLIAFRVPVIILGILLLVAAVWVMGRKGTELFPQVDSGHFTLLVRLPSGTRIEKTEEVVSRIEKSLMDEIGQPDAMYPQQENHPDSNMKIIISNTGVLMDWPAAYTPNTGPMDAFILVQLKGKSGFPGTFSYVEDLRGKLAQQFPGVEFAFDTGGMMTAALNFGLPSPINIQIQGSNLNTMAEIAQTVHQVVSEVPGSVDVRIAQRMDYPQVAVDVDRTKAAQLGLAQEDVIKNIVTAFNSSIGFDPSFWIAPNGNHYFIGAQYPEEEVKSLETLRNIPITGSASHQPIPLRNIADISRSTGPAVINHVNITRTIDIFANVKSGFDVGSVAERIEQLLAEAPQLNLDKKQTPRGEVYDIGGAFAGKGYVLKMSGEARIMKESFKQFSGGLLIAIVLVYLAMVAQLRSFSTPLVILIGILLAMVGVGFALVLTGTHLSIPVFMGVIMVTGISVEYSIILLEFANQRVREGLQVREAILQATWIRLRPIMMTSMTTWLALIPMAIGAGGGTANAPLARTIIGGVIAATVITLTVVPCLYVLIRRDKIPSANAEITGG
jgi:multidrug efflux pump subunit AcrB